MTSVKKLTWLGDSALLSGRAVMRAELEQLSLTSPGRAALSAVYGRSTAEINDRAREACSRTS